MVRLGLTNVVCVGLRNMVTCTLPSPAPPPHPPRQRSFFLGNANKTSLNNKKFVQVKIHKYLHGK